MKNKFFIIFILGILLIGSVILFYPKENIQENKIDGVFQRNITLQNSVEKINADNFKIRSEFTNIKNGIKQDVYVKNNGKEGKYNFSILNEIAYDEVTWHKKKYKLTENPIKFGYVIDNLTKEKVSPDIFFDDIFHKRINYNDVSEKGGYALAYKKDGKYYIEFRIDNINIPSDKEIKIDPTYYNQSDGFSIWDAGVGNSYSIAKRNSSDFLSVDATDRWVYDFDRYGNNVSGLGFPTSNFRDGPCNSITSNGTDIWLLCVTGTAVVVHADKFGNNLSWGWFVYADAQYGIVANSTDFFFSKYGSKNISHLNRSGGEIGIGFSVDSNPVGLASSDLINFLTVLKPNKFIGNYDINGNNLTGFSTLDYFDNAPDGIATNGSDIWLESNINGWVNHLTSAIPPNYPNIFLNSPVDNYNSTLSSVTFNCSTNISIDKINNISLFIDGIRNYTLNDGIDNFTSLQISRDLPDKIYNWSCEGVSNNSLSKISSNRTLNVITTAPGLNISQSNRTINYFISGNNLTFNWSLSGALIKTCTIFYEGNLYQPACSDNNISLNITNYYDRNINISVNNTFGFMNSSNFSWDYKIFQNSISYSLNTIENSLETFLYNITKSSSYLISFINFIYNGSSNSMTFTNNINQILSKQISIPSVTGSQNLSFYLIINFTDGSSIISNSYNQSVKELLIDDCSTYTNQLFNITMFDEDSQVQLDNTTETTKIELSFTIQNGSNIILNYSNISYTNPYRICFQNQLSNSSIYRLDGVIKYSSKERFPEFYNFQNYLITNITNNVSIFLYDLNSSLGKEFKITYKDSNFVPVPGAIMQIQRKYIQGGLFKTTEIPKTGTEGYTIGHLIVNDIIYNIIVMKNGIVLASFEDIVANCQNPLIEECNINLNSYSTSTLPPAFNNYNDFSFTLTYNKTTRDVESINAIPSGIPSLILLNVTLFDNLGNHSVCSSSYTGSGGGVNCIIPASFGNTTIVASLYKDGKLVGQSYISLAQDPKDIYGANLLFIALFTIFIIIGVAINDNPMIYGIIFALGAIVMLAINLIYSPSVICAGATILYLIISISLILIKGSNRQ